MYKFENLEVWKLALEFIDQVYDLTEQLPRHEDFNLKQQMRRAATSVALNIAEGSTGQSDPEQVRFLGLALRSLLEVIACFRISERRGYLAQGSVVEAAEQTSELLAKKIQAMRRVLSPDFDRLREHELYYEADDELPI